ncbi:TetR family transcriptional regulator protein (plasmid) [Rhizobium etli]|uniref:TetR family transcriptional regulator protein n=1 Tax=Rhizobium etli TaxID=29449 RepID=A0AAN1ENP6_RHIET|nr:TetR/AcrR family transcriptional regulator [Rhizobium etli]ARQ13811.1 TetR family transcriptional regulator protein [Rhizobium etli]
MAGGSLTVRFGMAVVAKKVSKRKATGAQEDATAHRGTADHYLERFELAGLRNRDLVMPGGGTRGRLLSEAVKLFAEMGYDACSVRDLAKQVGLGAPAIYNHYSSKREILVAAVDHILSEFFYHLISGQSADDPESLLFGILRRHTIWAASRQPIAKAFDALVNPAFMHRVMKDHERARFTTAIAEYIAIIRELLDEIVGPDKEVERYSRAYAVHEMADRAGWWFDPDGPVTAEELADQTGILIRRMIGLNPTAAS